MRNHTQILPRLVLALLTLGTPLIQVSQSLPKTIPVDITSYGGIVLQTRVNNSEPMWFYVDTGATSSFVIDVSKASALGLKLQDPVSVAGGAGPNTYEVSHTSGLSIALDQMTFANQTVDVMNLGTVAQQLGRSLDGLVGIDLFLNYVVEIDYTAKKLRLYDPKSYVYGGTGDSVLLTLRNSHFFVPAKITVQGRDEIAGQFLVDTGGAMMTVILTTPFARRNNLPASSQKTILDRSVSGLGGETRLLVGRATNFKIGSTVFPAPLVYISQDAAGALSSSEYEGVIGTEILKRFRVIVDYPRRRLILERNSQFEEPFEYDMSGMSLRAYGDDFRIFKIYQVLERSPAGTAGLRIGDIIESIDDVPASRLTLEQILQMMKVTGREYRLTLKRGSETRVVQIKTRRMI